MTDTMLLRQYLNAGSEEAFAQLARRHADWIHAAALRSVRDIHLAEDVTQAVFMVLAQKGRKVGNRPLNAWLFRVMRYSSIHALRERKRRERREYEAAMLAERNADGRQRDAWEQLTAQLDDSVLRLGREDRQAVLLRFYQRKSLAEVGEVLGVSEEAARKRVGKAVGQLRKMLAGAELIGSTELAEMLINQTTHPAPAGLAGTCAKPHFPGAAGAGRIAKGAANMMLTVKIKIAAVIAAALISIPAVGIDMATHKPAIAPPVTTTQRAVTEMTLVLRIKAASNLRQIGEGLLLYSNENRGAYPPTLGDLVRTESILPGVFLLPESPKRLPAKLNNNQQADWVNANTDFVYFGFGKTNSDIVSDILAAQKVPVPGDIAQNILFADGSTIGFPQELAEQLIAENSEPMIVAAKTAATPEELQDRRQCAGNLRHIWQMILLYRYHHAGQYPPDFNALQIGPRGNPPYDFKALQHLGENIDESCPSARNARIADFRKLESVSTKLPAWIFNQDDYVYAGNQPQPGRSDTDRIIAYDEDKNHGDGMNILFADGQVRWYALAGAHELIQQNGSPSHP